MAYNRNFAQLSLAVQQLGQWEGSSDITPAILLQAINYALIEGYDIMVAKWADYYTLSGTFALTAGVDTYIISTGPVLGLISNFYKLRHIDFTEDGVKFRRLLPMDLDSAYRYSTASGPPRRYRLQDVNLILTPPPTSSSSSVRIYYIPLAPQFASTSDDQMVKFDVPVEELFIVSLAVRSLLVRSDLSTSSIDAQLQRLSSGLRTAADSRDAGEPFYLDPRGPENDDDGWWC